MSEKSIEVIHCKYFLITAAKPLENGVRMFKDSIQALLSHLFAGNEKMMFYLTEIQRKDFPWKKTLFCASLLLCIFSHFSQVKYFTENLLVSSIASCFVKKNELKKTYL